MRLNEVWMKDIKMIIRKRTGNNKKKNRNKEHQC